VALPPSEQLSVPPLMYWYLWPCSAWEFTAAAFQYCHFVGLRRVVLAKVRCRCSRHSGLLLGLIRCWVLGVEQGTRVSDEARQVAAKLQADGKPLITWFIRYAPAALVESNWALGGSLLMTRGRACDNGHALLLLQRGGTGYTAAPV
jgi:hypothetical protein